MRGVTGVFVAKDRITAVAVGGSPKAPRVLGVGTVARQGADEPSGKALRALCASHGFPRDPVVVALPNDDAVCRSLALPFTTPEQVRRVLRSEVEASLPGISVEDVVVVGHWIGTMEGRGRVLAAAARKVAVRALLEGLGAGGIDPLAVGLEGFALANAVVTAGAAPATGSVVIVDADPGSARMAILVDGRVHVVRTVRLGVPAVVPVAVAADGLAPAPPEAPSLEGATGSTEPVGPTESALADVAAELTRTLVASGLAGPPDKVVLTGPWAAEPALAAAVATVTGRTPESPDLFAACGAPGAGTGVPGAAVALGAALKGLGADHDGINFRVDEFAFHRAFDQVSGALAALVTIGFLVSALWLGLLKHETTRLEKRQLDQILQPAAARFQEVWPDPKEARGFVDDASRLPRTAIVPDLFVRLRDKALLLAGGPQENATTRSALDVWRSWTDAVKDVKAKYWIVDRVTIEPGEGGYRLTLDGWLDVEQGREALDQIVARLRAAPELADTTPGETKVQKQPPGSEERLHFSVITKNIREATDGR